MIPSGSFNKETVDVCTVGSHCILFGRFRENLVVPVDLIDGDRVLSGEVLLETGEETLSEEESGDPEVGRFAVVDPPLDLF